MRYTGQSRSAQAGYLLWEIVLALLLIGSLVAAIYPNLRHMDGLSSAPPDPHKLAKTQLQLKLAQQRRMQLMLLQQ